MLCGSYAAYKTNHNATKSNKTQITMRKLGYAEAMLCGSYAEAMRKLCGLTLFGALSDVWVSQGPPPPASEGGLCGSECQ